MKLSGKTALITGASRGIGKAIALEMARQGAKVLITYQVNSVMAENVVNQIKELGQVSQSFPLDVSSRSSIGTLVSELREQSIGLHILVNNAGINKPNDFDKISDRDWDQIMDTNLKSVFMMGQELSPLLKEGASIINISSVSGQYGGPRTSHYCVSKAGMNALTQNMAIFFSKRNIRVNAVSPGLIESKMAAAANSLGIDDKILLGRRGLPAEVAQAVAFLASEEASYITAQTLNVNGGLYF